MERNKAPSNLQGHGRPYTGSLNVDVPSLAGISHSCPGCPSTRQCCCASYEVCVTKAEMERIIGCLPEASKFCPHLASKDGFDNVFDQVEPGLFAIDTDADGLCVFAYQKSGRTLCSLHAAAISLGIPLSTVKPLACILWPLALGKGDPAPLSVHTDALSFPCNTPRKQGRSLCPSVENTIASVFGDEALEVIEWAAAKGLRRVMVGAGTRPA